ncbi:MAG: hypothetical protein WC815_15340 [Vicinamibacterales bacterium]
MTVTHRAALLFIVFALALPDPMRADQTKKPATGVSGTWSLIATHKGPPGMPDGVSFRATVTFKLGDVMEESKPVPFDGYVTFQDRSEGAFMGFASNKAVTFTTVLKNPKRPGVTQIADFTGTLDADGTIKGHVMRISTGPGTYMRGDATFVATRR